MFGIIEDIISCPQCGMPATKKNYHVTGEESVACNYCGYTQDKTLTGTVMSKGYGCIHYSMKDGKGNDTEQIVRLKKKVSLSDKHKIEQDLRENYDADKSSFFVFDDKLECIVGTKSMTLEEIYEQQRLEVECMIRQRFATELEDLF